VGGRMSCMKDRSTGAFAAGYHGKQSPGAMTLGWRAGDAQMNTGGQTRTYS
jgi:hypothetical protein